MAYQIPLFNLNYGDEEIESVVQTIKSTWISTGPKCQELEELFCKMWNVKHAVAISNCTDSLHLACILCGFGQGDEVLCPSLTFAASANCIKYVGATPVFCDIKSNEDLTIDPYDIERKITSRTKGIVVVHMAGFPADMDRIMAIAKKHNLKVIEDACHGPLSEYKGKKLGTIGDVGCFSFFSNKNISTGEGGMLVTNNDEYYEKAKLLRSHGMTTMSFQRASGHATNYDIVELGYNFRLDDIHAALAIPQVKKLAADYEKRAKVRQRYIEYLGENKNLVIPFRDNTEYASNYIMPVVLVDSTREKRDKLREVLQEKGVQTSVHYPAIHKFSIYQDCNAKLPVTEYVTDNELTLPMYGNLTEDEQKYICGIINEFLKEN